MCNIYDSFCIGLQFCERSICTYDRYYRFIQNIPCVLTSFLTHNVGLLSNRQCCTLKSLYRIICLLTLSLLIRNCDYCVPRNRRYFIRIRFISYPGYLLIICRHPVHYIAVGGSYLERIFSVTLNLFFIGRKGIFIQVRFAHTNHAMICRMRIKGHCKNSILLCF